MAIQGVTEKRIDDNIADWKTAGSWVAYRKTDELLWIARIGQGGDIETQQISSGHVLTDAYFITERQVVYLTGGSLHVALFP